jgi:lactoylglutathione lyase
MSANLRESVPFFMVTNMERSLRFYVDGLGFEVTQKWTPGETIEWCWLKRGGASLMLQEYREERRPQEQLGVGVSVCFICDDALAFYREVTARGVEAGRPFVGNAMWVTSLRDPDGYRIDVESYTDVPEETEFDPAVHGGL